MAVTGMPSFRASFAEAAYNRDLLHRPAFWSDARSRAILRSQAALDAPSDNAGDRLRRSIFTRINLPNAADKRGNRKPGLEHGERGPLRAAPQKTSRTDATGAANLPSPRLGGAHL